MSLVLCSPLLCNSQYLLSFDIWDWRKGAIKAIKGLDPLGICSVCISLIRSLQVLWQNLENMYWDGKEGPCSSPLEEKESLANVLRFLLSRRIISTSTAASLQACGIREIATMDPVGMLYSGVRSVFGQKSGIPIENVIRCKGHLYKTVGLPKGMKCAVHTWKLWTRSTSFLYDIQIDPIRK